MENKEVTIEQMNDTISQFMNLKKDHGHHYPVGEGWCVTSQLSYHNNWNWLMMVVDKIGNITVPSTAPYNHDLQFKVEIANGYTRIEGTHERIYYNSSIEGSMLNATCKAVYQFITWYNQQKQNDGE